MEAINIDDLITDLLKDDNQYTQYQKKEKEYYTKTNIKDRGWNDNMINLLLGDPDKTQKNFKYKNASPICLYEKNRVHNAEKDVKFIEYQKIRIIRQQAAEKAVETKLDSMQKYLDTIQAKIPYLSWGKLTKKSIKNYNDWNSDNEKYATINSDEHFLNRLRVNYLRHELTKYEKYLNQIAGKVGGPAAYYTIKIKILDSITIAYPTLLNECESQKRRLQNGERK